MNEHHKTLLSLVRGSLWGSDIISLPEKTDWDRVIMLAKQQTTLGLASESISRLPAGLQPDKEILQKLFSHRISNIKAHALINKKLCETVGLMNENGIGTVLFKGQGLAMNYPDPLTRQCGDIDLYVGEHNYQKAIEVAIARFGEHEDDSESIKHYHLNNEGVTIELHKVAESLPGKKLNERYQAWTKEKLQEGNLMKVQISGSDINLPPHDFNAIYILNHAWHHFVNGGIGLRQLCDWTMFLHKYHKHIDIAELEKSLSAFNLLRVWHFFAGIAVRHLGLSPEECPLYCNKYQKTSDRILDMILDEGNFGQYSDWHRSHRPEGYTAGKLHSLKWRTRRFINNISIYPSTFIKYYFSFFKTGIKSFVEGLK